jgi:hypothetical protein
MVAALTGLRDAETSIEMLDIACERVVKRFMVVFDAR